jgi:propionate CoA-transferase
MVNLGIGLPEGVAGVAAEEGLLEYITLSTEPGVFGGLPCSGHSFGPALNPAAIIEMNEMFDFYDGGGIDICFLGAAEVSKEGNVNVSRMSKDLLTGPGGFINISQSTKIIVFMSPLTVKGLAVNTTEAGDLEIKQEGKIKKFVDSVFEVTFSGDEAIRRGQQVLYVTERCVFRRTANHPVLELIEIAPGIDLQNDILDQLDFAPEISPQLKIMDRRIYQPDTMRMGAELFGSLEDRATYHEGDHVFYLDLFGINLDNEDDIKWFFGSLERILKPLVDKKGPIAMVANYDGFDLHKGLEELYAAELAKLQAKYYNSAKRYSGKAFHRAALGNKIKVVDWDPDKLFEEFDESGDGKIQRDELREGMQKKFLIHLTPKQLDEIFPAASSNASDGIDRQTFTQSIKGLLSSL